MLINSPGSGAGASDGFSSVFPSDFVSGFVSSPLAFITNGNIIKIARIRPNNPFFIFFTLSL
jgi:hypothetical protein